MVGSHHNMRNCIILKGWSIEIVGQTTIATRAVRLWFMAYATICSTFKYFFLPGGRNQRLTRLKEMKTSRFKKQIQKVQKSRDLKNFTCSSLTLTKAPNNNQKEENLFCLWKLNPEIHLINFQEFFFFPGIGPSL